MEKGGRDYPIPLIAGFLYQVNELLACKECIELGLDLVLDLFDASSIHLLDELVVVAFPISALSTEAERIEILSDNGIDLIKLGRHSAVVKAEAHSRGNDIVGGLIDLHRNFVILIAAGLIQPCMERVAHDPLVGRVRVIAGLGTVI